MSKISELMLALMDVYDLANMYDILWVSKREAPESKSEPWRKPHLTEDDLEFLVGRCNECVDLCDSLRQEGVLLDGPRMVKKPGSGHRFLGTKDYYFIALRSIMQVAGTLNYRAGSPEGLNYDDVVMLREMAVELMYSYTGFKLVEYTTGLEAMMKVTGCDPALYGMPKGEMCKVTEDGRIEEVQVDF